MKRIVIIGIVKIYLLDFCPSFFNCMHFSKNYILYHDKISKARERERIIERAGQRKIRRGVQLSVRDCSPLNRSEIRSPWKRDYNVREPLPADLYGKLTGDTTLLTACIFTSVEQEMVCFSCIHLYVQSFRLAYNIQSKGSNKYHI
jgi:hypothetical protein